MQPHGRNTFIWVRGVALVALLGGAGCETSAAPPDAPAEAPPGTARPLSAEAAWPRWRGSTGMGHALPEALPAAWPAVTPSPVWRAELGTGWSSPVVAGGRVFITDRREDRERVLAFDAATGKPLWVRETPVDFDPHAVGRRHGNGPKATPLVDEDRVYAVGIAGRLACLDAATGRVVWEVNYPAEFGRAEPLPGGRSFVRGEECVVVPIGPGRGAPVPLFGYTGSPTLDGELLIAPVGGARGGTLIAFDKRTGQVRWQALAENVSYSSPVVATLAGRRTVVVMTGPRAVGLDVADGRLLWSYPFQIMYDESIGTPVVAEDRVLFTATYEPLVCLRIVDRGGTLTAERAWTNDVLSSYLSSMCVVEGHVYGMNDGGEVACLSLADGRTVWTEGNHGMYATPVAAGRELLFLNERAQLLSVAADPAGFRVRGEWTLARSETWTSPAVVDGALVVRGDGWLARFDWAPAASR